MKKHYLIIFIAAAGLLPYNAAAASVKESEHYYYQKLIKGQVKTRSGSPLQGVLVGVKGKTVNTLTDEKGYYSLQAEVNDVLTYELAGYAQQEHSVKGKNIDVFLQENGAEKWTNGLFGKHKSSTFSGSAAEVKSEDLFSAPISNVSNTLSGRLNGLITTQSIANGDDRSSLSLRGRSPIVVVDGAVRDIDGLSLNEIESITLLKDPVSLAAMGMRSSDGAVLVQTKRGFAGKQIISFSAQGSLQESINLPKYLDAYNYATLANEASANDGRPLIYSPADLEGYESGSDPYKYSNVNWYDATLKPRYSFNRFNLNVSGGGSTARYFVALENQNQGGIFKEGTNDFNTNNTVNQYNFRSNVEVDIDKNLSIALRLAGKYQQVNSPGAGIGTILDQIRQTPANAYPIFNKDGSLSGNSLYTKNISGQLYKTGYTRDFRRTLFIDADLNRKLNFITSGLSLTGSIHYTSYYSNVILRNRSNFAVFQPVIDPVSQAESYLQLGTNDNYANGNSYGNSFARRLNYDTGLKYSRSFSKHSIDASLRYTWDQYDVGTSLTHAYQGLLAMASYDYDERIFADVTVSYQGTEQYLKDKRYGTFPAISVGYNLAKEKFLENSIFDQLKLKASAGLLGFDRASNFAYQPYYSSAGNAYYFGTATGMTGWNETALGNPAISWEKTRVFSAGIDARILKNSLGLTIEYFRQHQYDVLQQRGQSNPLLGISYPVENLGVYDYSGIELGIDYQRKIGQVELSLNGNMQAAKSKVVFTDELTRKFAFQQRTGQQIGQAFGLVASGLFQNQAEIDNSPKQFFSLLQPGDIKYVDQNADGVINEDDVTAIGKKGMPVYYAGSIGLRFKNFDFFALLHGVSGKDFYFTGNNAWEFQDNGNVQQHHLNRWTPSNPTADYPRLTFGTNTNNHRTSTYWIKNGDYLRLKNVQLGYTFPSAVTRNIGLGNLRIFTSAFNLATVTKLKDLDPESLFSNYPLYKSYNIGLTAKF
ncbi:SusC/RagA family TonB-linked outer membrane protein [Pedobacter frigoris]|uniref:SusC/RagA family TonB-linked outer membrane protein n=1 Tax=Pedobacter frigoris TaxID=2571272 RepID=A0A4V6WN62_9SPHI|nr:SusC/RagA family TonB-linked outer membrane protein [Pedobacter frigoris]TKC08842.1 SusC/RagA family TonB-linked outer membrane protein [Pedobacter frigoris]